MTLWLALAFAQQYRAPFSDSHYGYFYPTAYYDHSGVDWACGGIRYSGHRGSDFGAGGFAGMDAGRDLVAAADGVVVATNDGEFDRCESGECSGGGGFGNYVAVQHDDGKITYYGHMKKWSVAVSYGQQVSCGQKLGQVGSSGWSTGPHIHFAVKKNGSYVDPFDGSCSGPPSYWTSQGGHGGLPGKTCEVHDSDGDGTRDDQDCAPNDKNVHPGATEVCDDGIDNDCSGGDRASELGYQDADGDGYGGSEVRFCGSLPGGVVRTPGDCDDGRGAVNPGARELCDGLDNDCNGLVDDGPPTEMADPPPTLAARLVDASYPGAMAPDEVGEVWFAFENVGGAPWTTLWLQSDGLQPSPLLDEQTWPAWNVLATLSEEVPVGGTGTFSAQVRAGQSGLVESTFSLVSDGVTVRCPGGEVTLSVQVRPERLQERATPSPTGCGTSLVPQAAAAGLLGLLALLWRRR